MFFTNNNDTISDFFRNVSQQVLMFVNGVELNPIKIKGDIYASGIRRIGVSHYEVHFKRIKQIMVGSNEYTMELPLTDSPEEEIWISTEFLSQDIVKLIIEEIANRFSTLTSFETAILTYKLKEKQNSLLENEEVIIYESKKTACKETIAKKKKCSLFKSSFIHFGENNTNKPKYSLTDEEFAEISLDK